MNSKKYLALAFAGSVLMAACSEPPESAKKRAQEQEATLNGLEQKDRDLFRQAGFEIVARTGIGLCWTHNNEMGQIGETGFSHYRGANTDIAYILKKSAPDTRTYVACVVHTDGASSVLGLRSIEKSPMSPGALP